MGNRIEWKGGECPVSGDTIVNIFWSDGSVSENMLAGGYSWKHLINKINIIAYEVIEEAKEIQKKNTIMVEITVDDAVWAAENRSYFPFARISDACSKALKQLDK